MSCITPGVREDLGPRTATLARQINTFDPDSTWQKVATE
jgi:Protein of unknown function (DUF2950)